MNDDVDMRRYGALRKALPITFATFALGYLAIIGVPRFSGFWSKDKIIEAAFGENLVVGLAALLGAGVTAFYMTRLMLMTFFGKKRWERACTRTSRRGDDGPADRPGGAVRARRRSLLLGDWIADWLAPVVGRGEHHELAVPGARDAR